MLTQYFIAKLILFLVFAVPASVYDWRCFRVPLWYICAGICALIAFHLLFPLYAGNRFAFGTIKNPLIAVVAALVLYVAARVLTGGALGWGDVIYSVLPALYTGYPLVFFATAFSALCGMLFYLALAVRDSRRKKQPFVFRPVFAIPYVPFITAGAVLADVLFRIF